MLNKLKYALLLLCLPAAVWAADFEDGKHYTTLNTERSAQNQVTEFFSFYCPHCFRFEPVAIALENSLPKGTSFVKSHVNFLGGISPQVQTNLSYAYIIGKQNGKAHQIAERLFNTIHVQRERLDSMAELRKFMAAQGISELEFDAALVSMPVLTAEKAMADAQQKFSDAGALTGVPTFIVNDKYKLNISELKSQDELHELVQYLLKK
ncbi:thiol:disulfide interchange protein DsbA/DsbL [Pseudoalteromonas fenneropenaei]|uniref:Thiol:disulfide interchange protein n=1 Tax=Pseudoalteromonas fenneropenaei TaxID=1737459 RepID=A0ABV7CQH8_9GAMM